jgi:hypothetical protein
MAARSRDLILVGQIHSHGRLYGVDLSPTDHAYGFRVPSFLSIVAPDYGMRWPISWTECGVHVFENPQGFVRLSNDVVETRIITEANSTEVITIGHDE